MMESRSEIQVVPRAYGSEVEYGVSKKIGKSNEYIKNGYAKGVQRVGSFYANGARMYLDIGEHPEYATPEVHNLDALVKHEIAGERHIDETFGSQVSTIHKRSVSADGHETSGAHENYSTSLKPKLFKDNEKKGLASHLVTRIPITGAGYIGPGGELQISQKTADIESVISHDTTRSKPIINTRDEPHHGGGKLKRLHVTSGDANISSWVIPQKFGQTSWVLRLLENDRDVSDLALRDPLASLHQVSSGVKGMRRPLQMLDGKEMTALDIQEEFANRAKGLSTQAEFPEDEMRILPQWISIIDDLRSYSETGEARPGLHKLDWFNRLEMVQRYTDGHGGITPEDSVRVQLLYDCISSRITRGKGIDRRKGDGIFAPDTPSNAEILEAMITPPPRRAELRGALIEALNERDLVKVNHTSVDWSKTKIFEDFEDLGPVEAIYTVAEIEEKVDMLTTESYRKSA
jgi:proteasome accessory factor A